MEYGAIGCFKSDMTWTPASHSESTNRHALINLTTLPVPWRYSTNNPSSAMHCSQPKLGKPTTCAGSRGSFRFTTTTYQHLDPFKLYYYSLGTSLAFYGDPLIRPAPAAATRRAFYSVQTRGNPQQASYDISSHKTTFSLPTCPVAWSEKRMRWYLVYKWSTTYVYKPLSLGRLMT